MVRLETECTESREVWAKLEFYNPLSRSIKDRAAWAMLRDALESGVLKSKLEEATSGNAGLALAALSSILGLRFTAYLPSSAPEATEVALKVFGACVVRLKHKVLDKSMWAYVKSHAERIGATNLNQFENEANFRAHYETTAREIIEQLEAVGRRPSCVVAGIGTSAHVAAIARRLRERYRDSVRVVGVQPSLGSTIPGLKRVEAEPKWLSQTQLDEVVDVSLSEAVEGVLEVARREGLFVGLSSGAVFKAYRKVSGDGGGVYVLVFPDGGFKYIEQIRRYLCEACAEGAEPLSCKQDMGGGSE